MPRAIKNRPYDPDVERKVYDAAYYHNHVKYYDKGIASFVSYLNDNFEFQSIADVGCGTGAFVAPLQETKKVFGFDFSVGSEEVTFLEPGNRYNADLAVAGSTSVALNVDLAMSLEVYEHIHPEFESIYLDNLFGLGAKAVILSCAPPGQWGRRHINCKSLDDVTAIVTQKYPYVLDEERTAAFKRIKKLASFYKKNTLVFVKK